MTIYTPICGVCQHNVIHTLDTQEWKHSSPVRCSGPYKIQCAGRGLNAVMDFDHIVLVNKDGSVTDSHNESAYFELSEYQGDDEEWHDNFEMSNGWELLSGWSGQYGYSGPVMHPSEFIGGNLEQHILETPGYWVALVVESYGKHEWQVSTFTGTKTCEHCGLLPMDAEDYESMCQQEPAGWALAHKPLEGN